MNTIDCADSAYMIYLRYLYCNTVKHIYAACSTHVSLIVKENYTIIPIGERVKNYFESIVHIIISLGVMMTKLPLPLF